MVSRHDDAVDFDKLEKQLEEAVELEARYWRENDAKFRAVAQKVATYEEFKDIVQASHLKPLAKGDKLKSVFKQPWNVAAEDGKHSHSSQMQNGSSPKVDEPAAPRTGHEFALVWRRLKHDGRAQFRYLLTTGPRRLVDIFKCEISDGTLSAIVAVLLAHCCPEHAPVILSLLTALTAAGRFPLSLRFLSKTEMATCGELFERLARMFDSEDDELGADAAALKAELSATRTKYMLDT